MKYWAFISYSHRDEQWAQWLQHAIETYRVPGRLVGKTTPDGIVPGRLHPVFRDRDELAISANLGDSIVQALTESRYLVVICSPGAAKSRWVNEEIRTFQALGREDRILCLIVDGEPNVSDSDGDASLECFPPALRYRQEAKGSPARVQAEPLAADARPGKDTKPDARLRILAALLGTGFDELKQREKQRRRAGQRLGLAFAALFAATLLLPNGPLPALRLYTFDLYQLLLPRERLSNATVVVTIDEESISRIGRWPWPRDVVALLIDRIAAAAPAVIAVDVVFSEPDSSSPERLAERFRDRDPVVAARLSQLRPNDEILADAVARAPVVLAVVAGFGSRHGGSAAIAMRPAVRLDAHENALLSLPLIDRAALGRGTISVRPDDDGTIRRMPLAAFVGDGPMLSFALEAVRVGMRAPPQRVDALISLENGMTRIDIGGIRLFAESDGRAWMHFAGVVPAEIVSAAKILEGEYNPEMMKQRVVLIGATAAGLDITVRTPRGYFVPGVMAHAELADNILDGALLLRPPWAMLIEVGLFSAIALLLILVIPHSSWTTALTALLLLSVMLFLAGLWSFAWARVLIDPVHVALGAGALFALMMTYGYFSTSARQIGPAIRARESTRA